MGSNPVSSFYKLIVQWLERTTHNCYVTGSNPVKLILNKHIDKRIFNAIGIVCLNNFTECNTVWECVCFGNGKSCVQVASF